MTLNCAVIAPDRILASQLLGAFEDLGGIKVVRDLPQYPHEFELLRMIRSMAPQVVFLNLQDLDRSFEIIESIQNEFPGLQIAVFHDQVDPQILLRLMQHGIREYIAPPFDPDDLARVLIRLREASLKNPLSAPRSNLVYAFLPSKPGSGTTTLAINASMAMARQPDTPAMLMDLDLNSGLVRFLMKIDNDHTILDAAEHAANMDEALWPQLVSAQGQLDILHSGSIKPGVRVDNEQIRHLIDYARKNYTAISIDLSGNMERYSTEVMQEAKTIFVVCTPEIPSLHLAREKFIYLKSVGLDEKVQFLLNRRTSNDLLDLKTVEELLDAKVTMSFPNDYRGVTQAVTEGRGIAKNSELGRQIETLAYSMLERKFNPAAVPVKKELRGMSQFFKFGLSRFFPFSAGATKGESLR
jgi:pilus assembly protein CpaE